MFWRRCQGPAGRDPSRPGLLYGVSLDTVEMSFLRGGREKTGFKANTGLPFQPVSRGANEVSEVGEAAWEKEKRVVMVELPNGKMLGMNWLVCFGWCHASTSQVQCQILGQLVPPTPFSAAHLCRQVGAWRTQAAPVARSHELKGREGEDARSNVLAVPEWPDGRQLLPKSEGPPPASGQQPSAPRRARPRGAPKAWGPAPGHVASVRSCL